MELKKNNLIKIEEVLLDKKSNKIAMLAPSFAAEFNYPEIIGLLIKLGFNQVVELTFGAKMINRQYHRILKCNEEKETCKRELYIASVCPGVVQIINQKYPQYKANIIRVDSPMIATAKICRRFYPKHKIFFISPCSYKKMESENSSFIDYTIDYQQLKQLFEKYNITSKGQSKKTFDRFYNDYTKVYPLSGGLSKTAHLKGVLKPGEEKTIDGIQEVMKFLDNPDKEVRFLDVTFCKGGCIGGPCLSSKNIKKNKEKVMQYFKIAEKEKIPLGKEGLVEKAKGIKFIY